MASIDDFGDTTEPLSQPVLGGPSGWAAAVRDYIKDLPGLIAGKVSKAGDTMTGDLEFPEWIGPEWSLTKVCQVNGHLGAVRVSDGAAAPFAVAAPVETYHAATRYYVDQRIKAYVVSMTFDANSIYNGTLTPPVSGASLQSVMVGLTANSIYEEKAIIMGAEVQNGPAGQYVVWARGNDNAPVGGLTLSQGLVWAIWSLP